MATVSKDMRASAAPRTTSKRPGRRPRPAARMRSLDAVALLDVDGIVTYLSPAITSLLGYASEALVGLRAQEVTHPSDRAIVRRLSHDLRQAAGGPVSAELRLRCQDGSWRRVALSGQNVLAVPEVGAIVMTLHALADGAAAPQASRRAADIFSHAVQFYETDDFLISTLNDFVRDGLLADEACILFATQAHQTQLEARLEAAGQVDLAAARAGGAYIEVDAAKTLAQIMAAGMPDPGCFAAVVGSVVARAASGVAGQRAGPLKRRRVRIFGELVALLCAEGNTDAAIRLEELWNELLGGAAAQHVSLLCAYPMDGFAGTALETQFSAICHQHHRVSPDETYSVLGDGDQRLREIALLQQRSHALEAEIAQRESTEARLRSSEARYRRLFEASHDGILIVDPDSQTVTDANVAVADLLGYPHADMLGRKFWQLGILASGAETREVLRELRAGRDVRYETVSARTTAGEQIYLEFVGTCFQAGGRDIIQCNLRDVTQRRMLEQRTQEALTALLAMARVAVAAPSAVEAIEEEEAMEEAEPARPALVIAQRLAELTCRVLGCRRVGISAVEPETEILRAVAVVGLTPDEEPGWWAERYAEEARGMRLGDGADPAELARFRAGEVLVVDMTAPPYRDLPNPYGVVTTLVAPLRAGEQLVGLLSLDYGGNTPHAFTSEETALAGAVAQLGALALERERLLAQRAAAQAQALAFAAANRRMNEFLSIASHELRTPLTTIKANLQLLARRQQQQQPADGQRPAALAAGDDARARGLLKGSERQVERLERLIDDMLDLARIREGKLDLRRQDCDLGAVVREEVELQRHAHPARIIRLELPAARQGKRLTVRADPDRIGQVVTNFLTNALKYSEFEQPVEVRVETHRSVVRVSVRDEGVGISSDEHQQVWEMFHRAEGAEVRSGSGVGLGLGLHIARTIVEQHRGTVGVESTLGVGSTFWFELPLVRSATR
ncbi:MAG: PAS domain S-box protein [Ktedonobacterales bacterium]